MIRDGARVFGQLWKSDPLRAAHWVAAAADYAKVQTPALTELKKLLALEHQPWFDASKLTQLVAENPELVEPLGSLQAARGATLGWDASVRLEPPTYTGVVRVNGSKVQLSTPLGTFDLAAQQGSQWSARWAAEVGAFANRVVTVRAWPDKVNAALEVETFAPGSSADFVQGRVTRTPDGSIAIAARPDQLVKVTNPELAARLEKFMRVAFILPGEAKVTPNGRGGLDWRYDDNPEAYYMLTKLNPGEHEAYDADTPFEKTLVEAADGHFPADRLGHRLFVYGRIADQDEGPPTDRVRKFTAAWVSDVIEPEWQKAAAELGRAIDPQRDATAAIRTLDPRVTMFAPEGAFQPADADDDAGLMRLARHWGVSGKHGVTVHGRAGGLYAQRWQLGVKIEEGPVDRSERKHGTWVEYVSEGDNPRERRVALKGHYEHGLRQGIWVQYKEGAPENAWDFKDGKLLAAGHVDEQLRPHGAWTIVGKDGLHDGGEGDYDHGVRVNDWWFYKPGTSDYERCEVYHTNGVLAAEGATELRQVGDQKYDLRVGEWKMYDQRGDLVGTKVYGPEDFVDGNGEERKAR